MGRGNGDNGASAKVRYRWAGFLLVVSVAFFVATAAFGVDLAKPAWGMFFIGVYVIFGNVAGDLLLRAMTGLAASATRTAERRETGREDDDHGPA